MRCGNWVLLCWIYMELPFQNQIFWVVQRGEHSLSSGQAKFDSQTDWDGKMLKTCFYGSLPMSLSETYITWWYWYCTTHSHTSTPSQLAKNAKCVTKFVKYQILPILHKFHKVLIFFCFPRWRTLQNFNFASPKVKDVWDFYFCEYVLVKDKKLPWRHHDLDSRICSSQWVVSV